VEVTIRHEVSIGHRLQNYDGLCRNLHGHNYLFEVTISGNPDAVGLVIDFSILKDNLRDFLKQFDHAMVLENTDPWKLTFQDQRQKMVVLSVAPSAENFASLVYNHFVDIGGSVASVRVQETSNAWAVSTKVDRTVKILGRQG
jgi:6-pyruvoyltetrahydropterin/6-carboxytetrahydropterin synthase